MPLRLRLVLTIMPMVIIAVVIIEVVTYSVLSTYLVARLDSSLLDARQTALSTLERQVSGGFGGGPGNFSGSQSSLIPSGSYAAVVSPTGVTEASQVFGFNASPSTHPLLPSDLASLATPNATYSTVAGAGGVSHFRVLDQTLDSAGDVLVIALPMDSENATLSQLLVLDIGVTMAAALVLCVVMWLVVRRQLRPLEEMEKTTQKIVGTDTGMRVTHTSHSTEVGRLGLAINGMLDRIDSAFVAQRESETKLRDFIADASHELRTPLTSMRGYAELIRRTPTISGEDAQRALRRIDEESQRMTALVEDLLLLARLDRGRDRDPTDVDLSVLVTDLVDDARAAAPQRAIMATIEPWVVVVGVDANLRQAIGNIVRNALVHTPPNSPIDVDLRLMETTAVVTVTDHGPGVDDADKIRVFERFLRASPQRAADQGGSGLGMSIALGLIKEHHGSIVISDTPGGGATMTITLPQRGASPPVPTPRQQVPKRSRSGGDKTTSSDAAPPTQRRKKDDSSVAATPTVPADGLNPEGVSTPPPRDLFGGRWNHTFSSSCPSPWPNPAASI